MKLLHLTGLLVIVALCGTVNSAQTAKTITPVSASASNSLSSNPPSSATDGDYATHWSSGAFGQQWIQLDLGQQYAVSRVRLRISQYPAGQTTHQIYAGATPGSLTLLGSLDGYTQDDQWLELQTSSRFRYLKIQTVNSPSWVAWREIEVYPTNSRISPTSLTASNSLSTNIPLSAGDGNAATYWGSGAFGPQWIQLDLGSAYAISRVRLNVAQYPAGQTSHQIYAGPSPNNLTLMGTLTGYTQEGMWIELTNSVNNVRYVRVNTVNSPSWVAWNEIQVYSGNNTQALVNYGYFASASSGDGFGTAVGGVDGNDYTREISDHSNVTWIAGGNVPAKLQLASSLGMKAVLNIPEVFFNGDLTLRWDYQSSWNAFADTIQPQIQTVAAFYPLDEPFHNGQQLGRTQAEMKQNLETIISTIKQRFPQTPTAVIFAAPTVKGNYGAFVIPTGYDWVGVDCYGNFDSCGDGSQSVPWYHDRMRDKLSPSQRMIIVPDGSTFSNPPSQEELVSRAEKYFALAQSDPTFVGAFTFLWQSFSNINGTITGTRDLPIVKEKYKQVGGSITRQP